MCRKSDLFLCFVSKKQRKESKEKNSNEASISQWKTEINRKSTYKKVLFDIQSKSMYIHSYMCTYDVWVSWFINSTNAYRQNR